MRFGDFELDLERRELTRNDQVVPVEPQVFDVLAHLVTNRHRVVTKQELLDWVWGTRFVSESALTSRVKSVRRAIGDSGRKQWAIKTVYGRGYRFVAPVDGPSRDDGDIGEVLATLGAGRGGTWVVEGVSPADRSGFLTQLLQRCSKLGIEAWRASAAGSGLQRYRCVLEATRQISNRFRPQLGWVVPTELLDDLDISHNTNPNRPQIFVAVREVVAEMSRIRPVLLLLEDIEYVDSETLSLIEHLSRITLAERVGLVVTSPPGLAALADARRISVSGDPTEWNQLSAPEHLTSPLSRVAVGGLAFDLIEYRAATGLPREEADRVLDQAMSSGIVSSVEGGGFRFRDEPTTRWLADLVPPHRIGRIHSDTAEQLVEMGAIPDRIAGHYLASDTPGAAAPFVLEAARLASAAEVHRDVLYWTGEGLALPANEARFELLMMRGASLTAAGHPDAIATFATAVKVASEAHLPGAKAGLARAAMLAGDIPTAQAALNGLGANGGPWDGDVLLAKGHLAYLTGDLELAERCAGAARDLALVPGAPTRLLGAVTLAGLVAHDTGRWFDQLRTEMKKTAGNERLTSILFDSHHCVSQSMLYGTTPRSEARELAVQLLEVATETGADRARAFASCFLGEIDLLAGALDPARSHLNDSVTIYESLAADAGLAHALQRLAELELTQGRRDEALRLGRRALRVGRWSTLSQHLLPRTYGTLIRASQDDSSALGVVSEARESLDEPGSCMYCAIMFAVPAAKALVEGGDLATAHRYLRMAEQSAALWRGPSWEGAVTEVNALLADREGRSEEASELFRRAAQLFIEAEQPADAERCRAPLGS